jgi:MFS family permease
MKKKRLLLAVFIVTLVVTIVLISLQAYYVAVALVAGVVIMGHREIWSLLKKRKMPPVDERVRENTGKAIRNGFIFFAVATAFLMLPFSVILTEGPDTVHVLGGLFISAGLVYLLSYLFYDRAEPKMAERSLRMLRKFLMITGISFAAIIISIFLHNAIYGLFIYFFGADFWDRTGLGDEPVFFFVALLAVVAFVVGIIGSLAMYIKGLLSKPQ